MADREMTPKRLRAAVAVLALASVLGACGSSSTHAAVAGSRSQETGTSTTPRTYPTPTGPPATGVKEFPPVQPALPTGPAPSAPSGPPITDKQAIALAENGDFFTLDHPPTRVEVKRMALLPAAQSVHPSLSDTADAADPVFIVAISGDITATTPGSPTVAPVTGTYGWAVLVVRVDGGDPVTYSFGKEDWPPNFASLKSTS